MRMYRLFLGLASLGFASTVSATPITYHVTVNTSSISGTDGSFDLNFNPGPLVTQTASIQVLNFMSNGSLAGNPQVAGDVSGGPLPAPLTVDNGTGFNDYFEGFTFGSTLAFDIELFGPALTSPNGTATSGSTFAFSMFSDSAGTIPALTTDPKGFAFLIAVNLDGTTSVTSNSTQTNVQPVPEPDAYVLLATAFAICGYFFLPRAQGKLK